MSDPLGPLRPRPVVPDAGPQVQMPTPPNTIGPTPPQNLTGWLGYETETYPSPGLARAESAYNARKAAEGEAIVRAGIDSSYTPVVPPSSGDAHDSVWDSIRASATGGVAADASAVNNLNKWSPTLTDTLADVGRQTSRGLAQAGLETTFLPLSLAQTIGLTPSQPGLGDLVPEAARWLTGSSIGRALQRLHDDNSDMIDATYGKPMTDAGRIANAVSGAAGMTAMGSGIVRIAQPLIRSGLGAAANTADKLVTNITDAIMQGNLPGPLYRAQLSRVGLWHGSQDLGGLMTSTPGEGAQELMSVFSRGDPEHQVRIALDEMGTPVVRLSPSAGRASSFSSSEDAVIGKVKLTSEAAAQAKRMSSMADVNDWQRTVANYLEDTYGFRAEGMRSAEDEIAGITGGDEEDFNRLIHNYKRDAGMGAKQYVGTTPVVDARRLAPLRNKIEKMTDMDRLLYTGSGGLTNTAEEMQVAVQRPDAIREIQAYLPVRDAAARKVRTVYVGKTTYTGGKPVQVTVRPMEDVLNDAAQINPTAKEPTISMYNGESIPSWHQRGLQHFYARLHNSAMARGMAAEQTSRGMIYKAMGVEP